MDLKEEDALGGNAGDHWYYASKARAMSADLPRRTYTNMLDIGAGSGFFSKWMLTRDRADSAICVDPNYPADREETVNGKPLSFRRSISHVDADLVLAMDVLEHVDDDAELLRTYVDLAPRAVFFISVPAFEFLWSGHDDFLEHRRRYTAERLRTLVEGAGLRPQSLHYYFGTIFPVAAAVRLASRRSEPKSDLRPASPLVNSVLKTALGMETAIMKYNKIAGLSVFCTCSKKAET